MRVFSLNLLLLCVASFAAASEEAAAYQDRQRFRPDEWGYLYYVTTATADSDEARLSQDRALKLIVPSVSRQPILERCLPAQVTPTLYRLDLRELQWDVNAWHKAVGYGKYPYSSVDLPLVIRADWLLVMLTDQHEHAAYYDLVFGKAPKTRDEALAALHVDSNPALTFGVFEGESGVSKQRKRRMESRGIPRGYAWGTFDTLEVNAEKDPIEHPEAPGKHDGEEWIIGIPKIHLASGARGALQIYFLANGQGNIVDRAPVDLVEDSSEFRGYREIRNAGSCINCHKRGLNYPTVNELRELIKSGVDVYARYPDNERVEQFVADVTKELDRANEDYGAIVTLACNCTPVEATTAFMSAVSRYDEDVTLERAACEFGIEPNELKLAIAWASAKGYDLGPRYPALAHGRSIPRDSFEDRYQAMYGFVELWRHSK